MVKNLKYICYNWMPLVADHIIDLPEDFYRKAGTSRLHNTNAFDVSAVKDGDLIFVKTDFIVNGWFTETVLPLLRNKFSLITGVSSFQLGSQGGDIYKTLLNSPSLNYWITTNPPIVEHAKIIPLPIGFQEPDRAGGNQEFLRSVQEARADFSSKKNELFLPYHNPDTNSRRATLIKQLSALPFVRVQASPQSLEEYYDSLNKSKFIIGLEGSGPDIHRNYETMLVGSIPVNIKNIITKVFEFHQGEGIFLNSWDELNKTFMENISSKDYNIAQNDVFLDLPSLTSKISNILSNVRSN